MGLDRDVLVTFHKQWFVGTPVNAEYARATLTYSGTPVAAEVVTIGGIEIYEFVEAAEDIAEVGNIPVILGATPTADNAVTKLAEAISSNSALVDAVASTQADTVLMVARLLGTEGNDITVETDAANASFGQDVENLSGGLYATPCKASMAMIEIGGVKYITSKPVDKWTTDGWSSIALTSL